MDEDKKLSEFECYALSGAGYETVITDNEDAMFELIEKKVPQLIVMDMAVNGKKGIDILKKIRDNNKTKYIPVMLMSVVDNEFEIVKGLDAGADDFLRKPFGVLEFISRIKALLRRIEKIARINNSSLCYEKIYINESSREVTVDDRICHLTYKEYELLKYMVTNKGIVLSR